MSKNQTIYKLNTDELSQAVADYITYKYRIDEIRDGMMTLSIQGKEDKGPILVTATVTWKEQS